VWLVDPRTFFNRIAVIERTVVDRRVGQREICATPYALRGQPVFSMRSLPEGYASIVIGASGGIGSAIAEAIRHDPRAGEIVGLSRSDDGLEVEKEWTVKAHAANLAERTFHLMVCATGALTIDGHGPEKAIRQIDHDVMAKQFSTNAIGPAIVLKHFIPLLPRKERSLFVVLSARVGSIGDNRLGGWISYRSAKAALNQIVKTTSIELSRTKPHAILVAIHPGTIATTLTEPFSSGHERRTPDGASRLILQTMDGLTAAQNGGFFAYDGSAIAW